ncbi:hypothetical protein NMU02_11925 [Coprobacter sp. LH1063]|uniref:Uncharacterized protein n=1 Tax=Coprobacter tertius TaxID=2944915 RepID=A0ABT1MJJ4_9BACT|nr:hypothetical protein [Coprobacter tertius]MCP9612799.1 hypothetical protein [Coprobacter tertius]
MDFFGQTANNFQLFEHKSELQKTKMEGQAVAHQQGEPTKITSYCDMSPTRVFRSGRAPASISRLPWSTTAW